MQKWFPLPCSLNDMAKTKSKTKSVSKLITKLDTVFSRWFRQQHADYRGYTTCYTCGKTEPWQDQQCGHYEKRNWKNTRYDPENCRVQCVGCNVFKNGNYTEFSRLLVQEKGEGILEELHTRSRTEKRFTVSELEELIKQYGS